MNSAGDDTTKLTARQRVVLFLLVFFCHFLITPGHLTSPDEELMFRTAESMALRGSTSIRPIEWDEATGRLTVPPEATFATRVGRDGRFFAQYLPLQPLLSVPLVWIGHATAPLLAEPFTRATWPSMAHQWHGGSPREYWVRGVVVALFNPLVSGVTALVLVAVGAALGGSLRAGVAVALLWAFATIGFAHARTYFTEPLAQLFAVLALGALLDWRRGGEAASQATWRLALWIALGVWVRVDFPLIAAGLLAVLGFWSLETFRARTMPLPALLFPLLVPVSIAAGSFLLLHQFQALRIGAPDITSGYSDQSEGVKFSTPLLVGLQGLLFSPGKGLLFFSPGLALALWGWLRARDRDAAIAVFLGLGPFFIAMALWQNWDGGWCWGPRHIVQIHAPLMLGAAYLFRDPLSSALRIVTGTVAAVGAAVQLLGASQSPLEFYTEYFNTPGDGEYLSIAYRPNEEFQIRMINRITDAQSGRELPASLMPAPLTDTLYVPQHTQWAVYPRMSQLGYNDLFFWRLVFPRESPDRWSERE